MKDLEQTLEGGQALASPAPPQPLSPPHAPSPQHDLSAPEEALLSLAQDDPSLDEEEGGGGDRAVGGGGGNGDQEASAEADHRGAEGDEVLAPGAGVGRHLDGGAETTLPGERGQAGVLALGEEGGLGEDVREETAVQDESQDFLQRLSSIRITSASALDAFLRTTSTSSTSSRAPVGQPPGSQVQVVDEPQAQSAPSSRHHRVPTLRSAEAPSEAEAGGKDSVAAKGGAEKEKGGGTDVGVRRVVEVEEPRPCVVTGGLEPGDASAGQPTVASPDALETLDHPASSTSTPAHELAAPLPVLTFIPPPTPTYLDQP